MGQVSDIASRAGIKIRSIGGLELIATNDMEKFLAACKREQCYILGIEGFYCENGTVMPDMEAIADFGSISKSDLAAQSVSDAENFFQMVKNRNLMFDVSLKS